MIKEFFFCKPLEGQTTTVKIFKVLNDFIEQNGISWEKCVGVCSDGARAVTGRRGGCSFANTICCSKCSLYTLQHPQRSFSCKNPKSSFKDVLISAIKIVNLIKARALNSSMFKIMCNNMSAEHDKLPLHTEVR